MTGPLNGLVVADFAQLAQGPFATQILGDMGAEIIKIEPPKGDWMRHWSMANLFRGGESVSFLSFNRNKRSIAIDLKTEEGREALLKLIETADVFLTSLRPRAIRASGGFRILLQRVSNPGFAASTTTVLRRARARATSRKRWPR